MEGSVDPRVRQQLTGHPFVRGLEPRFIEALGAVGRLVEFKTREVIFREDEPADTFYLVRSGVVALQVDAGDAYPQAIQHISEGSALGWSWLFAPYEWQFDAVALTPVRAIAFDAAALRVQFEEDPFFGYHIMGRVAELMVRRLHATRHQLINVSR